MLGHGDLGELPPFGRDTSREGALAATSVEVMDGSDFMETSTARLEMLMGVPLETAWLRPLEQVMKPARARMLTALGLPPPQLRQRLAAGSATRENNSYQELVDEMGY